MNWSWRSLFTRGFLKETNAFFNDLRNRKRKASRQTRRLDLETLEVRVVPDTSGLAAAIATPLYVRGPKNSNPNPDNSPWTDNNDGGYTPIAIQTAYGVKTLINNGNNGAGQTIAVVDAYDDPAFVNSGSASFSTSDLAVFDQTYGLPDPTFLKVSQTGSTTSLPPTDPAGPPNDWEGEESLDVEWAHAIAPAAKIILVECNTATDADLNAGVEWAASATGGGATVVSMSFGTDGGETNETAQDANFSPTAFPGVTFLASAGDSGSNGSPNLQAGYPADSPDVVSVGGTSLNLNTTTNGSYISESVWNNIALGGGSTGGGISNYESQPSYQQGLTIHDGASTISAMGMRVAPDVAFEADPYTGVSVYDSYDNGGGGSGAWGVVGGTSLSSPSWAGLIAIADQMRVASGQSTLTGATQTLPMLYQIYKFPSSYSLDFHDITAGDNGTYTAGTGYDLDSGIGTPIANELVPALAGQGTGVPPGPLVFTAASGSNNFRLVQSGADLNLYDNGTLAASRLVATTSAVQISGGTDNTLILDYSGGAFTIPVTFDGGSGSGVHSLTLQGATYNNDTFAPTSATAGTILLDSQTITFADVNSVVDLNALINYTIDGTSGADSINVMNGAGSNGTTTTEVKSGNGTFPKVDFANKVNVTILGLTGADTFTVNVSTSEVALANLRLDGGTTAGVVFNLQNIPSSVVTNVLGDSSADTINVGSGNSVQGINGALNLNNSAGAQNTIVVNDSADTVSQTVTLSSGSILGLSPGAITYVAAGTQKLTIDGGKGGNFFNVESASTGLSTIVNGGSGNASFNVAPLATGTSVTLNGQGPTTPLPANTLVYNGPGTLHPGAPRSGTITQTSQGTVTFTGIETVDVGADLALSTVSVSPQTLILGGGTSTVTLTARDVFGNQETSGGLNVTFGLGSGSGLGTFGAVTDNHNGTYTALFTGTIAGNNTITTDIGTQVVPVTSADTITVTGGSFDTGRSTVSVSLPTIASGSTDTVTLTVRNMFGFQEPSGGLTVVFGLEAGSASGTFGSVTDNQNGTYTALFTGIIAGGDSITATINTQALTSTPPTITVTPGALNRAKSTVTVSPGSIASSGTATVTLMAEDAAGNLESNSSYTVGFGLGAGSASGTFGSVTDNPNGTYTAVFTGIITGSNSITTTINTQAVTSTKPTITVTPGAVNLANSTVTVSPGTIASSGTSTVTLTARDSAGNLESNSSYTVGFGLGAGSASGTFGNVTNNNNGTYTAIFTGNLDGSNSITTTINTLPVTSTEPTITVTPGTFSLAQSTLSVSPGSIASSGTATVTLTARDAAGNLESNSSYTVGFGLANGSASGTFGSVTDNPNGTYTAVFTGIIAGSNSITATINSQAVTSTEPTITVTPGVVNLANSPVTVTPGTIASSGTATVTLTAEDAAGNLETSSSYTVGFGLGAGLASGTFGNVTNNLNGTYTAVFTGILDGSNSITTTINTLPVTSTAPTITVTPGPVSVANSTVTVTATPAIIPLDFTTTVTLTARDAAGNLETSGGDSVAFGLGNGSANGTFGPVIDKNNGTYTTSFTGLTLGTNTITATIDTNALTSTAPTVTVTPGPVSLANSTLTVSPGSMVAGGTATVTLTAEDAFGNVENSSAFNVVFGLGSGSANGTFSNIVNNHNGTYTGVFTGTLAGTNTITATINTQALTSTAPTITVTPNIVSLAQSTVSVSSASIPDGQSATVTLTARDAYGNLEIAATQSAQILLSAAFGLGGGSGGGVFGAVTNNHDGTFTAVFTGNRVGTNTITGIIGTQAVTSTPPTITVTPLVLTLTSGNGQSATVGTTFANPLVVTLTSAGFPVSGAMLIFSGPLSGPGAYPQPLSGGTVTTNAQGQASVNVKADTIAGTDTVYVSISLPGFFFTSPGPVNIPGIGVVTEPSGFTLGSFTLTNNPGAPAAVVANTVGLQSTVVNTAFAAPLVATVADQFGNPISGATVNFVSPGAGAGVTFPNGSTATTNAQGQASIDVTANTLVGLYTVMASVAGVTPPASFALSNDPSALATFVAASGGLQSAVVNTAFTTPLVAKVTDQYGNPISGITVNFAGPGSGAGVTFPNGSTATTNTQGQATINVTANANTGSYTVTASVPSSSALASFGLTNNSVPVVTPVVSQPPVIAPISVQGVNDGGTLSFAVMATTTSAGLPPLTFSLAAGSPAGATINVQTGLFTWTPSENNGQAPGNYTFTVTAGEIGVFYAKGVVPPAPATMTFTVLVGPSSTAQGTGYASRLLVANGLTQSYEYYANIVTAAYAQYLNRAPDAMGLAFWVGRMQNGLSDEQLEAGFIGSPEFIIDHGNGDNGLFVTGLYQTLLGRAPQPSEVQYWVAQLNSGLTPQQVALDFTTSPEREAQRVQADYQQYLGRSASATEVDYWVNVFLNGGSNEQIVAGFVASPEYFQDHGNNIVDWLFASYRATLNREPDAVGYQGWLDTLQQ